MNLCHICVIYVDIMDNGLSAIFQKLNHEIEEIRVRALHNVISKLDHGLINDDALSQRRELFGKLLKWFQFHPCSEKEKVLKLLLHLVKVAGEKGTLMQLEAHLSLPTLYEIQKDVEPPLQTLIDQIIKEITRERNDESAITDTISGATIETDDLQRRQILQERQPLETKGKGFYAVTYPLDAVSLESLLSVFPHLLLPWQPLVETDHHVLTAVESSLTENTDVSILLHSCQFFTDVLLQDFPSEVFLQRPAIVKALIDLLENSHLAEDRVLNSVTVKCLLRLSEDLLARIRYYCDPSTANLKQEGCLSRDQAMSGMSFESERTLDSCDYLENSTSSIRNRESEDCTVRPPSCQNPAVIQEGNFAGVNDGAPLSTGNSDDNEDSVLEQLQQLSLPQFCTLALHAALRLPPPSELCDVLITLLGKCVAPGYWESPDPAAVQLKQEVYNLLHQTADAMQLASRSTTPESHLVYFQLLSIVRRMILYLVPIEFADSLPRNLKEHLLSALNDFSLICFYPELHGDIKNYCRTFTDEELLREWKNYVECSAVCRSMSLAVRLLKECDKFMEEDIVTMFHESLLSLEFHHNLSFIDLFMEKIVTKTHRWSLSEGKNNVITKSTLTLLAHRELEVKQAMYGGFHKLVLEVVGLNYSRSGTGQLKILFNTDVLSEIVCFGMHNEDSKVKQYATEIMVHLLKSKLLIEGEMWQEFLIALIPVFPLLQCFLDNCSAVGRCIAVMLDQKNSQSIQMPMEEVLKGNIRALFCIDELVRKNAIIHLCYMLTKEVQSHEKLPNLSTGTYSVMANVCILEKKVDFMNVRIAQGFYEVGSLCHVMELMTDSNADPRIRRSALSQLNAMLEDSCLQAVFLDQGGLLPLMTTFHSSLVEKGYNYYPDSVVPVISILKKICLGHANIRQELSQQISLYYGVLRALFLFSNDEKFRSEAAQLLCLLLYSEYIILIPQGGSLLPTVSLPEIVCITMCLPFVSKIHWNQSHHTQQSMREHLMQHQQYRKLLQTTWTCEWYGGVENLLKTKSLYADLKQTPFSSDLRAHESDVKQLLTSSLSVCMEHMYDIQNATTHQDAESALKNLTRYFNLYLLLPTKDRDSKISELLKLPWGQTFARFLATAPGSLEDETLLSEVFQFLFLSMKVFSQSGNNLSEWCNWFLRLVKEEHHPLVSLLRMDVSGVSESEISARLCQQVLQLCQFCFQMNSTVEPDACMTTIQAIILNLRCSDTQHFYNLAYLNSMLSCLAQLTASRKWSASMSTHLVPLIKCLIELVKAFHCGKGSDGPMSFMGLSITRNTIICLNHVLNEIQQHSLSKNWEDCWSAAVGEQDFLWLASLWFCRDPLVRASSLQLVAGLSITRQGCVLLLNRIRNFHIWETALRFLLDHNEACIVREQAALVLVNLSSHIKGKSSQTTVILKQDAICGMLELLEQNNFYSEIATLVSRLFYGSEVIPGGYIPAPVEAYHQCVSDSKKIFSQYWMVYNGGSVLDGSVTSSGSDPKILTTPSLVKSVSWFMLNLVLLHSERTLKEIQHCGLIRIVLRSIDEIPVKGKHPWKKMLYSDVVEMYTAICALLSLCVSLDSSSHHVMLHTHGCLKILLQLLNTELFCDNTGDSTHMRNELWGEVFRLLSAISTTYEGYKAVMQELHNTGKNKFVNAIQLCLKESSSSNLLKNALCSLTYLFSQELKAINLELENCNITPLHKLLDESGEGDLCLLLLHLFDVALHQASWSSAKHSIFKALGSLLALSKESAHLALARGFLDTLLALLRDDYALLSLEGADGLINAVSKRKLLPVLKHVESIVELLTNFLYDSINVKSAAANCGLADLIHKIWLWCSVQLDLQIKTLKLLCTFTTNCPSACRSLVLTSTVQGIGQRKTPSALSLLHTIVNSLLQEMSVVSRPCSTLLSKLMFHVLKNACHAQECRVLLAKSTWLRVLPQLSSLHQKSGANGEQLLDLWLDFLMEFTSYPEGQLAVPKVTDSMETLIFLSEVLKNDSRLKALSVLRNIAFLQLNRPRLLALGSYMKLLSSTLSKGSLEEKHLTVQMVWALIANNQKAKITIKATGIVSKLQEELNKFYLFRQDTVTENKLEDFSYVLRILNADEGKMVCDSN